MKIDALISQLEGVRRTGKDRWMCRCPSHGDRTQSLSVRELDDGRVLVHCFAGCDVASVLGAVGLNIEDLFPDQAPANNKGERRPFPASDVLRALAFEASVVAIAAGALARGTQLTEVDRKRLFLAAQRINTAVQETGHA